MGFDFQHPAVPQVDDTLCTVCALCAAVCPTGTLALEEGRIRIATRMFTGCIGCGQCMAVCAADAIRVTGRRLDPSDMVALPAPAPARSAWEALDGIALARRSVRRFAPRPVEREVLERILSLASTAPMGIPPTEVGVVVFDSPEKVHALAADAIVAFRRALRLFHPLALGVMRPFMGAAGYRGLKEFVRPLLAEICARWDEGHDVLFYDAPAALLFHRGPSSDGADAAIAATYAMLAAQALGLGSCMIGTTAGFDHDRALKRKYGIPEENKLGLALILGYPEVAWAKSLRRQWASVHWPGDLG
ncbi:MAG: nitroreductase family protein [Acidobacteria bacterium]|jgi:nitroreductase/Pyruvate/2-oxoacid:ferredoxin oxidoreductase delta subunit|nr:nitroreductase family protein [Acidobacteriota bacterium]